MQEKRNRETCRKYYTQTQLKLAQTQDSKKRNKKIDEALQYKVKDMNKKGLSNLRNWRKVTTKSENPNGRPGYHVLIGNISHGTRKL